MADKDKPDMPEKKGAAEDFLQVFKKGVQFTEELLDENERLRVRVVQLEEENHALAAQKMDSQPFQELLDQIKSMGGEGDRLLERFSAVESESRDFKRRYQEIEEENNRLANLYIASFQLHSTLDLAEVVRVAFEIIVNLVGSMDFTLFIKEGSKLVPVCSQGRDLAGLPLITIGKGIAGKSAQQGILYISGDEMTEASLQEPKVCVPLLMEGKLLGLIVIFSFLDHKTCITELDRELFNLLGGHAATALYSARLNADSKTINRDAASYIKILNS
jgi:nitrate/nitrite-specific signal transduction histidine kinase